MARYHIVSMSLLYSPTSAADRPRRSRLRKTVDFTIEPRPSGAVIPGAFTYSFLSGAVLQSSKATPSREPVTPPPSKSTHPPTLPPAPHPPAESPPSRPSPLTVASDAAIHPAPIPAPRIHRSSPCAAETPGRYRSPRSRTP